MTGVWTEALDMTGSKSQKTPTSKSSEYAKVHIASQSGGSVEVDYEKIPSFARVFIYDSMARTSEMSQRNARISTFKSKPLLEGRRSRNLTERTKSNLSL